MSDILINKNLEPLREFIDNLNYKEIIISKPYELNIETKTGEWLHFHNNKLSLQYLFGLSRLLAIKEGKVFNEDKSNLAAIIDNKHRVNVVYGKQTNHDISVVIRLKRNSGFSLNDFSIPQKDRERLIELVKLKKTILISGGTHTGKTTLLNSLIKYINPSERIITIENVQEIEINPEIHKTHDALLYLEDSGDKTAELLNSCLRMRPDRIIIGELRYENSYVFLRACNTGHEGTLSTIHANNPQGALDALVHNIKSSGKTLSHDEKRLREELAKNIDAVIQINREYVNKEMVVTGYLEENLE